MAAATGSSIKKTLRAPAETAASTTAWASTLVTSEGTQSATRGLTTVVAHALRRKYLIICSVIL